MFFFHILIVDNNEPIVDQSINNKELYYYILFISTIKFNYFDLIAVIVEESPIVNLENI